MDNGIVSGGNEYSYNSSANIIIIYDVPNNIFPKNRFTNFKAVFLKITFYFKAL